MPTHDVLAFILVKMTQLSNIARSKPRHDFLCQLFCTLLAVRGRFTCANLARYSGYHERTFRRHFARAFDWLAFNLTLLHLDRHPDEPLIGVLDTTFIEKAGKKTYGLDRFFSTEHRQNRRGLEVSLLGTVSTLSRRCIGLDATQTPPGLATSQSDVCRSAPAPGYTRTDFYLEQLTDCLKRIDRFGEVRYWVGDGFYAKRKFFDLLCGQQRHLITRLRSDANLRFLAAEGEQGPSGRKRHYAGKVHFDQIGAPDSRFQEAGVLEDLPHVRLYTALVNSPHLKRDLRVVVLWNERDRSGDGRPGDRAVSPYVVLASTDLEQAAEEVVAFFRLRFQIELLIRDAKQHLGLEHCQARDEAKLDFHFNMSISGVNLARLLSRRQGLPLQSYLRESYNRYLLARLQVELGPEAKFELRHPAVERVAQIGRIAA